MDSVDLTGVVPLQQQLAESNKLETQQLAARKAGIAGRYIFVMNAAGEFFAAKGMVSVLHHSSFMAGGAVACAGEVAIFVDGAAQLFTALP